MEACERSPTAHRHFFQFLQLRRPHFPFAFSPSSARFSRDLLHLKICPSPASARGTQSGLSAFLRLAFRGCKRTFSPFHRGVVTTYALEVGAAGEGDNRDHSLFAFRAARCSIHEILPIFHP